MSELISSTSALLGVIITVSGGVFAFLKWVDTRNRELRDKRYLLYVELIGIISGRCADGTKSNIMDQIAAVWFMLEYPEYKLITKRIFSVDVEKVATPDWNNIVLPHVKSMLGELDRL